MKRTRRSLRGSRRHWRASRGRWHLPETGEAVQKLLSNIADDIEEELKDRMRKACAKYTTGALYGPENLYMTAVSDFMETFYKALDKMEYEMMKEEKE